MYNFINHDRDITVKGNICWHDLESKSIRACGYSWLSLSAAFTAPASLPLCFLSPASSQHHGQWPAYWSCVAMATCCLFAGARGVLWSCLWFNIQTSPPPTPPPPPHSATSAAIWAFSVKYHRCLCLLRANCFSKRLVYFQNGYAAAACWRGARKCFLFFLNVGHFISRLLLVQSLFTPFLTKSIISSTLCCSVVRLLRDAQGTITYEQCRLQEWVH